MELPISSICLLSDYPSLLPTTTFNFLVSVLLRFSFRSWGFDNILTVVSLCSVGHWSIQYLSFRIYTSVVDNMHPILTLKFSPHHDHEREEHEEGHQARHGYQYVVCSHSSSWVILYWRPRGREINLYFCKFLLSSHVLSYTRLQLGNKSWKSHELIWKYCSYEKLTNNKDYLRLTIKI